MTSYKIKPMDIGWAGCVAVRRWIPTSLLTALNVDELGCSRPKRHQ